MNGQTRLDKAMEHKGSLEKSRAIHAARAKVLQANVSQFTSEQSKRDLTREELAVMGRLMKQLEEVNALREEADMQLKEVKKQITKLKREIKKLNK